MLHPIRQDFNVIESTFVDEQGDVHIEFNAMDDSHNIVEGNCPRQSLRRNLIKEHRWNKFKYVFCDFEETRKFISIENPLKVIKSIDKLLKDPLFIEEREENKNELFDIHGNLNQDLWNQLNLDEESEEEDEDEDEDEEESEREREQEEKEKEKEYLYHESLEEEFKSKIHPIKFNNKLIFGFNRDLLRLLHPVKNSIVMSILYRLYKGYKLYNNEMENKNVYSCYLIQLNIDIHIHLCRWIIQNKCYEDDFITSCSSSIETIARSAYDLFYPSFELIEYGGKLPDITNFIEQGNTWYNIFSKQSIENEVQAMIHIICCKTETQKCQGRNFTKILKKYFLQFPALIRLFRQILCISLLGNYPFCKRRTSFKKRTEIYYYFWSYLSDEKHLFQWISENPHIVYYCTKECHVYIIEEQYAFDEMKKITTNWSQNKKITKNTLDIIRSYINESTLQFDAFQKCAPEVDLAHKSSLKFLKKLKKDNFCGMAELEMRRYFDTSIVNQHSTSRQNSEDFLPLECKEAIHFVVNHIYETRFDNHLELKWLKCFGITEKGLNFIKDLAFDYNYNDISDNGILKRFEQISKNNERDFHIIYTYFKKITERKSVSEYLLPLHVAEQQLNALKAKNQILPWESLPENLDVFAYCPCCKKWANPIVHPVVEKTKSSVYSLGYEEALYDERTQSLYCGKTVISANMKKILGDDIDGDKEIGNSKLAKSIRKQKEQPICTSAPLILVHMIGKIIKVNHRLWCLCSICASLMEFDGSKFSRMGLTCLRHDPDSKFNFLVKAPYTRLFVIQNKQKKEQASKKSSFKNDLDRARYALKHKKMYLINEENLSKSRYLLDRKLLKDTYNNTYTSCIYCGSSGVEKEGRGDKDESKKNNRIICNLYRIQIIDDDDYPHFKIISVCLCSKDYKAIENTLEIQPLLRKKVLIDHIQKYNHRKIQLHGNIK